jgi:hypothetical protein
VATPPAVGPSALTRVSPPARERADVSAATSLAIAPAPREAPPPPPENAACTPQVVALGLCPPASR